MSGHPDEEKNLANAAFIVRAVNAHGTLVEALKAATSCALEYDVRARVEAALKLAEGKS